MVPLPLRCTRPCFLVEEHPCGCAPAGRSHSLNFCDFVSKRRDAVTVHHRIRYCRRGRARDRGRISESPNRPFGTFPVSRFAPGRCLSSSRRQARRCNTAEALGPQKDRPLHRNLRLTANRGKVELGHSIINRGPSHRLDAGAAPGLEVVPLRWIEPERGRPSDTRCAPVSRTTMRVPPRYRARGVGAQRLDDDRWQRRMASDSPHGSGARGAPEQHFAAVQARGHQVIGGEPMNPRRKVVAGLRRLRAALRICSARPAFITIIRCASVIASTWSCVTYRLVVPSLRCSGLHSTRICNPQLRIEIGKRLVEQEHRRLAHNRAVPSRRGWRWPARELPRLALEQRCESSIAAARFHARVDVGFERCGFSGRGHVVVYGHVRVQREFWNTIGCPCLGLELVHHALAR